jgi:hypothetical protein
MDYEDDRPRRGRNWDDERNSDSGPRRSSSNRNTILVLCAAGCGLVLLCSGLIAAALIWGLRSVATDVPAAQTVADQFLDQLQQGQLDGAYALTSTKFRAEYDRKQFEEFIKKYESFTHHTSRTEQGFRLFQDGNGKHVFFQKTLNTPNNAMTCTLVMIEEAGNWKVEKITVP